MRTFVSINIPEEVKREIVKIQKTLPEFFGKKTEIENFHLTLKFLGEVDKEKIEKAKARLRVIKFDRFEAEIDSIGVFSEKFIKIVWLHLTNCENLQKRIDEGLEGLFEKEGRFMGHLTIARIKSIKDRNTFIKDLKKIKTEKIKFKIDKFYLMKSELTAEGPKYSVLEEYNLN